MRQASSVFAPLRSHPACALLGAGLLLGRNAFAVDAFPDTIYGSGFEPCSNYECAQVHCAAGDTTSISGTVYAPNGTLPLPNVEVYVPNAGVAAFVDGPNAPRCDVAPSGHPLVATLTGVDGKFKLTNVPAGVPMIAVVLAGKWRRQIAVPALNACVDTPLDNEATRLPATHLEGDIPLTAITTGNSDAVECLLRKTGVADTEFGTDAGSARFHIFTGNGASQLDNGGGTLAPATALWGSSTKLAAYDQIILGCQGSQPAISAENIDSMKAYADSGGRIYAPHWHNIWIAGSSTPPLTGAWPGVATFNFSAATPAAPWNATIVTNFEQGARFAQWLYAVGASTTFGALPLSNPRQTAISVDASVAQPWISLTTSANGASVPHFTFTTPIEAAASSQKGRVLFVDLHDTADVSATGASFPSVCTGPTSASAQEKALLYAIFDLQRCVGSTKE